MSDAPESKKKPGDLSFEDAVKRLSEIVQKLERGDLPLEESLLLFEEGVGLSRASQDKLDSAQKRVEELLGEGRDGKARTAPFETRGDREG
ncbi:MAG: exodeoxyribonuclease VII small subunit [Labilithrix sp.]|nr:exodeoxyribonuclease VII small subunit [Labilithrix sp.]MBX3220503.1 exodeoxyribonuclease VII small subunit [Labilithrix sp.]